MSEHRQHDALAALRKDVETWRQATGDVITELRARVAHLERETGVRLGMSRPSMLPTKDELAAATRDARKASRAPGED